MQHRYGQDTVALLLETVRITEKTNIGLSQWSTQPTRKKFGNQNCQLIANKLKVRVIPALEKEFGRYVDIPVKFSYKQDVIKYVLQKNQAMNYRFVRKKENWYLFVTTKYKNVDVITNKNWGAIGVDLNHSYIAVAETNRHGNLVRHQKIYTFIQDRTCHQVTATLAESCKQIISFAVKNKNLLLSKN
ncbi:hypothetical protein [Candidatus Uabimicrobium sp. HlEnr_7]|uniref:hypothetical protein n=1 Tax=Candidatus Uabimicrobium helgolandensis TaxID=3095367 RepID=UPI003555EB3C